MGTLEKWRKRGRKPAKAPRHAYQVDPPEIPAQMRLSALRVEDQVQEGAFDDLEPDQAYVINPPDVESGDVLQGEPDPDGGPPTWTPIHPDQLVITDGDPPASSPTPFVTGGPRWLAVNWDGVANVDPVTYEVHVSTSNGFTPSGSTMVGEVRGTLMFVRNEPDDTPLEYDTTYYVKLIAKDDDGSASASAQDSATLDRNATDDITAGSITADRLEAVLSIANLFVAGSPSAEHLELDSDGFRSFDSDGTTELINFPTDGTTNRFNGELFAQQYQMYAKTTDHDPASAMEWYQDGTSNLRAFIWAKAGASSSHMHIEADDPTGAVSLELSGAGVSDGPRAIFRGVDDGGSYEIFSHDSPHSVASPRSAFALQANTRSAIDAALESLSNSGARYVGWTLESETTGATITMTSQRLAGAAFIVHKDWQITEVVTRVTTAGTSFNNYSGAAIYEMETDGDWNFLMDTGTNNTTLFSGTGERSLALTTPLDLITNKVYVVALLSSWTGTAPVIAGLPTVNAINLGDATFMRSAGVSSRTTRANTDFSVGALSAFTNVPFVAVR